jgi:nitrile hydratase accessory protein
LSRPKLGFLQARDGDPVFGEPWHAQTLALADLLVKSGAISSARWAETLGAEIKALNAEPDDRETYYRAVLAALERLLAENGRKSHGASRARAPMGARLSAHAARKACRTHRRHRPRVAGAAPYAPKSEAIKRQPRPSRASTVARRPNGSGVTPRIQSSMRSTSTSTKIAFARSASLGK